MITAGLMVVALIAGWLVADYRAEQRHRRHVCPPPARPGTSGRVERARPRRTL